MLNTSAKCYIDINRFQSQFTPNFTKIAKFIIDNPEKLIQMTIDEVSAVCGISVSCVVRFCKLLGYSGYKELCRIVATDLKPSVGDIIYNEISPGDSAFSVFRNTCLSSIRAIENTLQNQDEEQITKAVEILSNANRIDFYGIGTSGLVAMDAHNKFVRTGKICIANQDFHLQLLAAASLKPDDVAVLISYSGETPDIILLADALKSTKCKIITITSFTKNRLIEYADAKLYSLSMETYIRSGAMSSRISQMTIIDALYLGVSSRIYDQIKDYLDKGQQVINITRKRKP